MNSRVGVGGLRRRPRETRLSRSAAGIPARTSSSRSSTSRRDDTDPSKIALVSEITGTPPNSCGPGCGGKFIMRAAQGLLVAAVGPLLFELRRAGFPFGSFCTSGISRIRRIRNSSAVPRCRARKMARQVSRRVRAPSGRRRAEPPALRRLSRRRTDRGLGHHQSGEPEAGLVLRHVASGKRTAHGLADRLQHVPELQRRRAAAGPTRSSRTRLPAERDMKPCNSGVRINGVHVRHHQRDPADSGVDVAGAGREFLREGRPLRSASACRNGERRIEQVRGQARLDCLLQRRCSGARPLGSVQPEGGRLLHSKDQCEFPPHGDGATDGDSDQRRR